MEARTPANAVEGPAASAPPSESAAPSADPPTVAGRPRPGSQGSASEPADAGPHTAMSPQSPPAGAAPTPSPASPPGALDEAPPLPTAFRPTSKRLVLVAPERAATLEQGSPCLEEHLELLNVLGRGGMGNVHAARDRHLLRTVALKVLNRTLTSDPSVVRRFFSEAQVLAQLEHPNIVPFFALEQTRDGSHAFSMRLVEGKTLGQYARDCADAIRAQNALGRKGKALDLRFALGTRLEHFLKVCDAMSYAHSRGVIHRDLKPENIMLGGHNEVYVMDWGIALVLDEQGQPTPATAPPSSAPWSPLAPSPVPSAPRSTTSATSLRETQHNQAVGTFSYMPPEQAAGRIERPHPTIDVFALGMILQELVTLQPARAGREAAGLVMSARAGVREPVVHRFGASIAVELRAVIEHATAPHVADRYASVEALADDLRRFLRGEAVTVLPDPWTRKLRRWLGSHPVATLAALLVVVLVAAGLSLASLLHVARRDAEAAEAERRAAMHTQAMSDLMLSVTRQAEGFTSELGKLAALVDEIGTAATVMLDRHGRGGGELLAASDLTAAPDFQIVPDYGEPVSFDAGSFVLAPDADARSAASEVRTLTAMVPVFQRVVLQAAPSSLQDLSRPEQLAALRKGLSNFYWVYIGLSSGLLIGYPGNWSYPADYDPRKRPWYEASVAAPGTVWGDPYADAFTSRIIVPVHRRIVGPNDELLGVAGGDVTLEDFYRVLSMPGLAGWKRSLLVDTAGRVLMDSAVPPADVVAPGGQVLFPLLDNPAVLERIRADVPGGHLQQGGEITVFHQLVSPRWYFVVVVAADSTSKP